MFQDPASYLNPNLTVGSQVTEVLRVKRGLSRARAHEKAVELLTAVGLRQAARVFHQIPAELSGGMLQRVMIAIAISCDPELLIADEATTALDVTIQAEIIELIKDLRDQRGLAVLFVSHDLAVIRELCDRVVVFYAGEVVEAGPVEEIIERPRHPYTQALLRVASVGDFQRRELEVIPGQPPHVGAQITGCRFAERCPAAVDACRAGDIALTRLGPAHEARCVRVNDPALAGTSAAVAAPAPAAAPAAGHGHRRRDDRGRRGTGQPMTTEVTQVAGTTDAPARPLLEVADVDVVLGRGWRANHVLSGVNLKVWPGEIIGLVGETGSGKTTLARTVVGLARPRDGRVLFDGKEISALRGAARRRERRTGHIQLVFQDPLRSLDPDLTVGDIVGEGLKIRGGLSAAEIDGPRRGRPRQGRPERGAAVPAAWSALRRPAPAGLDRQGPGGGPEAAAVRRAGQRARREQQELHPAAARRAARQPRPADRDHLARPVLAGRHRRPGGRALPGPDRRGRPGGPGVHHGRATRTPRC